MILRDFHIHTVFCDGKCTPEEAVKAAIKKGLLQVGILTHSHVTFDDCCISLERVPEFLDEIRRIKEKYRGIIEVFCGIEADIFTDMPLENFDYVIGSVHYLKHGERFISVDNTPQMLMHMIDEFHDGDFYSCAEDYFKTVSLWAKKKMPDIIGHFDLIKKFNKYIPFDPNDKRYISAWKSSADALLPLNIPFEVNTGGISRGWIDEPYPSYEIAQYIKSKGGRLILSSDAHSAENICYEFDKFSYYI